MDYGDLKSVACTLIHRIFPANGYVGAEFMARKLLINHRSATFQLSIRRVSEEKFTPIL